MVDMDKLADAINVIKSHERVGKSECTIYSTKLIRAVLDVMAKEHYINGYQEFSDRYAKRAKVSLAGRINKIGVVKPRYAVTRAEIQKYEERYIPSRDFGILILSTPKGIITNREARAMGIGGRLLAYVY